MTWRGRLERWAPVALWVGVVVSWLVLVWSMWEAMTTVPSAERLQESRMAVIPGPRTFLSAVLLSAFELAFSLVVLWPRWTRYYALRLAGGMLALATWFVMTTPMRALSRMDWVHRRWLALLVLVMGAALLGLGLYRLLGSGRRRPASDESGHGGPPDGPR